MNVQKTTSYSVVTLSYNSKTTFQQLVRNSIFTIHVTFVSVAYGTER